MENRWRIVGKLIALGLVAGMLPKSAAAAEIARFAVSQSYAWLPRITAYVDLLDTNGEPVTGLRASTFLASVQERPVKIVQIQPFAESGEGVAYIFLIDISKSISVSQFEEMRQAINTWIDGMTPVDRMAIFTFGDECKSVIDFTSEKQELKNSIAPLAPTDGKTLIHLALQHALELSKRSDKGLPVRRAVVVLSDGKDEGSGLTADDLVQRSISSGTQPSLPIYAIGYSHLPPNEKQRYLDELHRFAVVSGGLFREAESRPLADTYAEMNHAIRRVLVLRMECDECRPDLQAHSLQISANLGGAVQSATAPVIFLGPPLPSWWSRWGIFVIGGGVLFAIIIGIVLLAKGGQKEPPNVVDLPFPQPGPPPTMTEPAPRLNIRLDMLNGRNQGSVHEIGLYDRARIGRSNDCELVLAGSDISNRHCELILEGERVFLHDLRSTNGTMLNGVPIVARERLETGDIIRLGDTELRITIGPLR
jgi:hypothetical protein